MVSYGATIPIFLNQDKGVDYVQLCETRACRSHNRQVNVNGGAIALGHPIGATGAMLLGTVLDELERRDLSTGLVTLCIGGGMGIATVIERV